MSLETRLATVIAAIGADIKALQSAGGGSAPSILTKFKTKFELEDDFVGAPNFNSYVFSGGTVTYPSNTDDGAIGVVELSASANSSGCAVRSLLDAIQIGRGKIEYAARVKFPILSASGDTYNVMLGLFDADTNSIVFDGAYFFYDQGFTSPNWVCKTVNNFTATSTVTGIAVPAGVWVDLAIEINAAGTEAKFYIDGTLVATMDGLPTGANRRSAVGARFARFAATAARSMIMDYMGISIVPTTPR